MSRKSPADKLSLKRTLLAKRTAAALCVPTDQAIKLLGIDRHQSIRLNPLVAEPHATLSKLRTLGWRGTPYSWMPHGYSIDNNSQIIRDSTLAQNGTLYIQNAASWLPVLALDAAPKETVLDVCAAPGGKTSHIAAYANNQALITANDNSRPRLAKLQQVCSRLNAHIESYTLYDAQLLARKLNGRQFDKILLDAPCSGEGLMRWNYDRDFQSWSVAQIKRLQSLQKRLIRQAWQLLRPGGSLVYSTCTIAPEENEAVIDYAIRRLETATIVPLLFDLPNKTEVVHHWNNHDFDSRLDGCLRLQPSAHIEAFFICKLQKG